MSRIARLRQLLRRRRPDPDTSPDDAPTAPPIEGYDLLFISDLHLGEACKEHSRIEYLKRAAELDGHMCAFLEHHIRHRPAGRRWRLVLGGDLLDFLQVTMVPPGTTGEALTYGLGTREEESVWKLQRLMERHRDFFVFLAAFVGEGNALEIIQGNHDEELFWPAVRDALVDGLVDLYFGDEGHPDQTPEDFVGRIRFHTWFFIEPGLVYVEHGHRFDDFCTTPPQLCPLKPGAEDELTDPLSSLAIRYFANRQPGFRTHDKEHWGLKEYYRYLRSIGIGPSLHGVRNYIRLIGRVARYHQEHGRGTSETAVEAHDRGRLGVAERYGLEPAVVARLDALGARSIMGRPLGLWTMMGMSEWSAMTAVLLTVVVALATDWGAWVDVPLIAAMGAAGAMTVRHLRARYPRDIKAKLDRAAEAIADLVEVPVVVMGHSHRPVRRRLHADHRRWFINTGTFLTHEEVHHAPGEPCTCRNTFAVLAEPAPYRRAVPQLKRWCVVESRPAPFD